MKSDRLKRLQTGTIIALVLYMLILVYMFYAIATSNPMANKRTAEWAIQHATTMQELQHDFRDDVGNLSFFVHKKNELLLTFCVSTFCMIGFLGWSLFVINRLKREDSIGHAA